MSKHTVYASIIDAILDDVSSQSNDPLIGAGLRRGKDFRDISTKASNTKFLDEIAGESNHTSVPGGGSVVASQPTEDWRKRSARVADTQDTLLVTAMTRIAGEDTGADGTPDMTDQELKTHIANQLTLGVSPKKIAADLEVNNRVYNTQMAHDYLQSHSGRLGLAYLNPDQFGNCQKTFDTIKSKGSLKAASVKRIAACGSCQKCSGGSRCTLYKLPIIASADEAKAALMKKFNTTKQAALVTLHNKQQLPPTEVTPNRTHVAAVVRSAGDKGRIERQDPNALRVALIASKVNAGMDLQAAYEAVREEKGVPTAQAAMKAFVAAQKKAQGPERVAIVEKTYSRQAAHNTMSLKAKQEDTKIATIQEVAQLLGAGHSLGSAYSTLRGSVGSHTAAHVVKEYVNSLKKTASKVDINQIDCSYLKGKLASSNAIMGSSKCGSCTYRCNGMHCGLTGGTLLAFPGMGSIRSKRANYEGVKDGVQDMASLDMMVDPMDITYTDAPKDTMLDINPDTRGIDIG